MIIEVYSDGSGNTFDSDGGYGYCIVVDGELHSQGSGYAPTATNNTMEVKAAIEGLKAVKNLKTSSCKVVLVSDSQLALNWANGKYKCKAEHLKPLVNELRLLHIALLVENRWVRGHTGDKFNELCDQLAGAARKGKGL